jgi:hypothetical protein
MLNSITWVTIIINAKLQINKRILLVTISLSTVTNILNAKLQRNKLILLVTISTDCAWQHEPVV